MAELLRIGYGKEAVSVYRTDGVSTLFAAEVGMTARGEASSPPTRRATTRSSWPRTR